MPKPLKTWICVADGAHARIVTPQETASGYAIVTEFDSTDAHRRSRNLGSDRPGRAQESAYSARHAVEPRSDPQAARKREFVRMVAEHLDRARERGDFDELLLFAPAPCLHDLRANLGEATRRKIRTEAAKDLINLPLARLAEHIAPRRG